MSTPASQFIDESVKHPDWLRIVEGGQPQAIVQLANEQGFQCSIEDLKRAASELLAGNQAAGQGEPDKQKIDEAASGLSDLEGESGYGDDTGYAALYGVAGMILKVG